VGVLIRFFKTTNKEREMSNVETFKGRNESFIVVKDASGEEYICPQSALKKKSEATDEELKKCIPDSQTGGPSSIGG
jgi:hypothetical protein